MNVLSIIAVLAFPIALICVGVGIVFRIGPDDNLFSRDTWRRGKQ